MQGSLQLVLIKLNNCLERCPKAAEGLNPVNKKTTPTYIPCPQVHTLLLTGRLHNSCHASICARQRIQSVVQAKHRIWIYFYLSHVVLQHKVQKSLLASEKHLAHPRTSFKIWSFHSEYKMHTVL